MPEEFIYLAMIESGLNPKAYSKAMHLEWQFISSTESNTDFQEIGIKMKDVSS